MENELPIWHCPIKNQIRVEHTHLHTPHTHTQWGSYFRNKIHLNGQRPKQLQFSDSMHSHGPPKEIMLTYQIFILRALTSIDILVGKSH